MQITKEFLDQEIANAEAVVVRDVKQLSASECGLSVLRQMRGYLDKPEPEPEPEPNQCPTDQTP